MKQEFLKSIAFNQIEIKSYHTIEKMNRIEQLEYNFLHKSILEKLAFKLEILKRNTNPDMFKQTEEISKLKIKLNIALGKVA